MADEPLCGCNHLQSQHPGACAECACPAFHHDWRWVPTVINRRWTLNLPSWRGYRREWPVWEAEHIGKIFELIRDIGDPVIFDVGAEQGDMPALWASWGARVLLIEPSPAAWPVIRLVFAGNNLTPAGCFVGFAAADDWEGHPDFDATPSPAWPACAYDVLRPDAGFRHLSEMGADVGPRARLDTLAVEHGLTPDVITIDVEGAEYEVLAGASGLLAEARPQVVCSVHETFMADGYGHTVEQLAGFMAGLGYRPHLLADDHERHVWWQPV